MNIKTERFEMRLDPVTLDKIDNWRSNQTGFPSRAEAIRSLIDEAIDNNSNKQNISMNDGDRLIVMMLRDIYKKMGVKGEIDPDFFSEVIHGGHYWAPKMQYHMFSSHRDSTSVLQEVIDILDMWSFLEEGYIKMPSADKKLFKKLTSYDRLLFPGFDGNNESEYMNIAGFLIEKMGRFKSFENRILNSHMPTLDMYRRMLNVFLPIRKNLVGRTLTADEIVKIFNERIHPTQRK